MQRGQNQVPGERRLHGDFGGFLFANLTDHNDIRVLAQHVLEDLGETQTDVLPDFVLVDDVDLVFDRIFDSDDILFDAVEMVEGRIETGGLAAAGRTGHQDKAITPCQQLFIETEVAVRHAKLVDIQQRLVLVEHTQHHFFAETGRAEN